MKLFVLGGSGLIGNELVKQASLSHNVIATYNNRSLKLPNVSMIKFSFPDDFENIKKIIIEEKPDVIINLIAHTNLDYCESNKKNSYELNVILPEKISNICSEIHSKFIHISTDYVFDGKNGNYNESDEVNPINYYGYTKKMSEMITLKNPTTIILRTSLVYDSKLESNFLKFLFKKLNLKEKILVYDDILITPILLDELIESILTIIPSNNYGIFHISGETCVSRFEFAKYLAKVFGFNENFIIPISFNSIEHKVLRPHNTCLKNNKIKEMFEIKFSTLQDGFNIIYEKYRSVDTKSTEIL